MICTLAIFDVRIGSFFHLTNVMFNRSQFSNANPITQKMLLTIIRFGASFTCCGMRRKERRRKHTDREEKNWIERKNKGQCSAHRNLLRFSHILFSPSLTNSLVGYFVEHWMLNHKMTSTIRTDNICKSSFLCRYLFLSLFISPVSVCFQMKKRREESIEIEPKSSKHGKHAKILRNSAFFILVLIDLFLFVSI